MDPGIPRMMRPSAAFLVVLAALAAGCGGGRAEPAKSASEVLAEAKAAALDARSVHMTSGQPVTMSLYLVHRDDAKSWFSKNGSRFDFIRAEGAIYARAAGGTWRKLSATGPGAGPLASLTLQATFTTGPFAARRGALVNAGEKTYHGEKVIEIRNRLNGDTLYVAASDRPYPVAFIGGNTNAGRLTFDRWNEPVTVKPPS
jgi:hypothetical protein